MLFDTDVLIWALRGDKRAATAIDEVVEREISIVNYMELVQGARDKRDLRLLRSFTWETWDKSMGSNDSSIYRKHAFLPIFNSADR